MHRPIVLLPILLLLGIAAAGGADPAAGVKQTIVTTAAHCDWTWGHSRAWHEDRYAQIIHDVLLLMRKYPRYVWQLENENEELAPFLKKAQREWPGMVEEFWQRVREGRIEVIVGISDPRLCEIYPETLIRNLVLGKQYFRRHAPGLQQPVYHAVDLMVGHSQMPQVLAQADYQYFMFSRPCKQKQVFWRTGLDGTRMLCGLQHYGYDGTSPNGIRLESRSGDDILPDEGLAKAAETWDPAQKVLATSVRFFAEVEKAGGPLPELHGVLDSLESNCCGTGLFGNHNLYTWNNQNEDLLLSAERARTMASTVGVAPAQDTIDAAWHDLLSCVGHAILWSWKPDYEERLEKARQTRALAQRLRDESLAAVVRAIRFRADVGEPLVVFNFHAWPVTGPVEFTFQGDARDLCLRDVGGGDVPLQRVRESRDNLHRLAFVAEDVPACGYATYYLSRVAGRGPACPAMQSGPGTIANELVRICMDADGRLRLIDSGQENVGSPTVGELAFYETPKPTDWMMNGPLGPRHALRLRPGEMRVVQGPVFSSLIAAFDLGPQLVVREVQLWRRMRRVDFTVEMEAATGCGLFFLRFPLGLPGSVTAGIPFGAEPRQGFDREPFRGEYFAQGYPDAYYATRWTDVSTDQHGYTFIAPHGMHNGFAYQPQERALEFALLRVRPMPQGVWGQVHPSVQGTGFHCWHCALVPHAGTWHEAATYRDALELHTPLLAFSPQSGLGRAGHTAAKTLSPDTAILDEAASFAEVRPAHVVLSSLRCLASGEGRAEPAWELRVYETAGQATEAAIRLSRPVQAVVQTNLLGEPVAAPAKISTAGREIRLAIAPWKIVTLRITPGKSPSHVPPVGPCWPVPHFAFPPAGWPADIDCR